MCSSMNGLRFFHNCFGSVSSGSSCILNRETLQKQKITDKPFPLSACVCVLGLFLAATASLSFLSPLHPRSSKAGANSSSDKMRASSTNKRLAVQMGIFSRWVLKHIVRGKE